MKIIETRHGLFLDFTPYLYYTLEKNIIINMFKDQHRYELVILNFQKYKHNINLSYHNDNQCIKIQNGPIPKLLKSILNYPADVISNDVLQSFVDDDIDVKN